MLRSQLLRSNGGFITDAAFRKRKAFFNDKTDGAFNKDVKNANSPLAMLSDPSVVMQQQKVFLREEIEIIFSSEHAHCYCPANADDGSCQLFLFWVCHGWVHFWKEEASYRNFVFFSQDSVSSLFEIQGDDPKGHWTKLSRRHLRQVRQDDSLLFPIFIWRSYFRLFSLSGPISKQFFRFKFIPHTVVFFPQAYSILDGANILDCLSSIFALEK